MNKFLSQIEPYLSPLNSINWINILTIIILALLLIKFGHIGVDKTIRKTITRKGGTKKDEEQRENTLISVFNLTLNAFVAVVAVLMILSEIGINIGPLIAGAGIAGIAIGFGAQYLIKDIINGTFILLENQFRVGDVACFDGTCGMVEDINLRVTTLRDLNGTVHYIPNGEIKIASNLSKQRANVNLDIGIAYSSDIEKVIKVVNKVGIDLAKDKDWKDKIRIPPQFLRVDDFADSAIIIKIKGETEPIEQWGVMGELRKRLKIAFDKQGIEIPFPQRDVHIKK